MPSTDHATHDLTPAATRLYGTVDPTLAVITGDPISADAMRWATVLDRPDVPDATAAGPGRQAG